MTRVGVRELRQNASRYLEQVKQGGTIEVTERGRLIALLTPPGSGTLARDRLISEGRLEPAAAPFVLPVRRTPPDDTESASSVLDALRHDRLA